MKLTFRRPAPDDRGRAKRDIAAYLKRLQLIMLAYYEQRLVDLANETATADEDTAPPEEFQLL